MSIDLDVVIDTPEYSVDMKSALDSLKGVSDATRCIAEAVLTEKTPQRQTHKGKVRTTLKQSFKGSYGQIFSLDVYDEDLQKKFKLIGEAVFAELISYFISESLYKEHGLLSEKAQNIVNRLGETCEDLVKQLRVSALQNIHKVSTRFNRDLQLRYRKNRNDQIILARFDRATARVLNAVEQNVKIDITISVTRLNINTGNGRLLVKGEEDTVAFGFGIEYKAVSLKAKKMFSENLDYNNGIDREKWKFLRVSVVPVLLRDGSVVKYIIKGFYGD